MNSQFLDSDDEFYLQHEDEYEVLRDLEENETQNVFKNNTVSNKQQTPNGIPQQNMCNHESTIKSMPKDDEEKVQVLFTTENKQSQSSTCTEITRKRLIDQISQNNSEDICNSLDFEDNDLFHIHEKKRPCWDRPQELIKIILDKRKPLFCNDLKENCEKSILQKIKKNCITRKVPQANFVAITRSEDGERFYIKVSERNTHISKILSLRFNILSKNFYELKKEADQLLLKIAEKAYITSVKNVNVQQIDYKLWVDKYRPRQYIDLLSDENINRSLLYWLKLWDKIVFDNDHTIYSRKFQTSKFKIKLKDEVESIPCCDIKGYPIQRIALISGSPGLGKTTLAHVAARHAGYNVVELNASDDRGPEAFREALLATTQMKALLDKDRRPNCLILDEIDGAPATSIELLLKFIHGQLHSKGRHQKVNSQKLNDGCRRPIICICNDLYTPSLRVLRNTALLINVPEIIPSTLATRLSEIAHKEKLNVDSRVLMQLAEKSGCDIRACLGILQYTGGGPIMLQNIEIGLKNVKKGLFNAWKDMFQIPINKRGILTSSERTQKVIKILQQSEPDRLSQGIFHNYPLICKDNIVPIYKSLGWFEFYDEVNTIVMNRQRWDLMPYLMSAFVAWHVYMAGLHNPQITFPTTVFEINQKTERNQAILLIIKKMSKIDTLTLVLEVLPYLPDILSPNLRSVNVQLYSEKEKYELNRLVNVMLDFGLKFTQERKSEGGYDYYLDPNIWNIGTFPNCKIRKILPYAVKQVLIQELETAKLQRAVIVAKKVIRNPTITEKPSQKKNFELKTKCLYSKDNTISNHLEELNQIQCEETIEKKSRNYFQAFQLAGQANLKKKRVNEEKNGVFKVQTTSKIEDKLNNTKENSLFKSDVWFQYIGSCSNAIRRPVLMEDL